MARNLFIAPPDPADRCCGCVRNTRSDLVESTRLMRRLYEPRAYCRRERRRRDDWRFLTMVLIHPRQQFGVAIELTILGHHFRKLAASF